MSEAIGFLLTVLPPEPEWSVLVAIDPKTGKPQGLGVSRGTIDEAAAWIKQHADHNLYWSVNSLSARLDRKPKKGDITFMRWVHADVDDRSDAALARIRAKNPTLIVMSGGGYQAFWALREPVHVNGNIEVLEAANLSVVTALYPQDISTRNLDRIMRIAGTTNWPNASKLAKGRVPVMAEVVEHHPELTYALSDFPAPAPVPAPGEPKSVDRSKILFNGVRDEVFAGASDEAVFAKFATDPHVLAQDSNRQSSTIQRCIDKAREALADGAAAAVQLNEKHAIVWVGNHMYVLWRNEGNEGMPRLAGIDNMRQYYGNQLVGRRNPFNVWLNSPIRSEVKIVFSPGQNEREGEFNLWRGWPIQPVPGDCSGFLDFIRAVICSRDDGLFRYVLGWCADAVQNPANRPGVVLVLKGKQGTGKGTFAHALGRLFGNHYVYASRDKHVTGEFNAHQANKLLMFSDEAVFAGEKKSIGALKSMITEGVIPIEMKGKDIITVRNHLRIIMASNEDWVVPAAMDDRRFAVIEVSDDHKQDTEYFKQLCKQLDDGGHGALLHHLLNYDLSKTDLRALPKTAARTHQQLLSLPPIDKWWYGRLLAGSPIRADETWPDSIRTAQLYEDYQCEVGRTGVRRRATDTELGMRLRVIVPGLQKRRKLVSNIVRGEDKSFRAACYLLPPLAECRQAFQAQLGHDLIWPEESVADQTAFDADL